MTLISIELDDDHSLSGKAKHFHDQVLYDLKKDITKEVKRVCGKVNVWSSPCSERNNPLIFIEGETIKCFDIQQYFSNKSKFAGKVFRIITIDTSIYKPYPATMASRRSF